MSIDQPHRRSDTEPIADAKVRSVSSLRIFCNQKLVSDSRIQTNTQRGKGAIGARFTKVCAKSSTCNISREDIRACTTWTVRKASTAVITKIRQQSESQKVCSKHGCGVYFYVPIVSRTYEKNREKKLEFRNGRILRNGSGQHRALGKKCTTVYAGVRPLLFRWSKRRDLPSESWETKYA